MRCGGSGLQLCLGTLPSLGQQRRKAVGWATLACPSACFTLPPALHFPKVSGILKPYVLCQMWLKGYCPFKDCGKGRRKKRHAGGKKISLYELPFQRKPLKVRKDHKGHKGATFQNYQFTKKREKRCSLYASCCHELFSFSPWICCPRQFVSHLSRTGTKDTEAATVFWNNCPEHEGLMMPGASCLAAP